MEKNITKYESYKNAYEQIDAAIAAGFYLEAITIEESIMTDRLFRFCRDHGLRHSWDRATLGSEIKLINEKMVGKTEVTDLDFIGNLEEFWGNRNKCLHQIVKSEPGTSTQDFHEMLTLARKTAVDGKTLCKKVSNWSKKYELRSKKVIARSNL